jgi:hypothetical protein
MISIYNWYCADICEMNYLHNGMPLKQEPNCCPSSHPGWRNCKLPIINKRWETSLTLTFPIICRMWNVEKLYLRPYLQVKNGGGGKKNKTEATLIMFAPNPSRIKDDSCAVLTSIANLKQFTTCLINLFKRQDKYSSLQIQTPLCSSSPCYISKLLNTTRYYVSLTWKRTFFHFNSKGLTYCFLMILTPDTNLSTFTWYKSCFR